MQDRELILVSPNPNTHHQVQVPNHHTRHRRRYEDTRLPQHLTLETPTLRYDVDSMQHWLDLNA